MEISLDRKYKKEGYTISNLYVGSEVFCNSLEDTDRGLKSTDSLEHIRAVKAKYPKKTAIPSGRYRVTFTYSPKFHDEPYAIKGMIPLINGVKGFSAVRMHAGINAGWTDACVLVGRNTVKGGLGPDTKEVCGKLFRRMYEAVMRREDVWITIC